MCQQDALHLPTRPLVSKLGCVAAGAGPAAEQGCAGTDAGTFPQAQWWGSSSTSVAADLHSAAPAPWHGLLSENGAPPSLPVDAAMKGS